MSTYRMTKPYISYLWFSLFETPGILRMTNGHPYGGGDLLRIYMAFIGKVAAGGSRPSPTINVACAPRLGDIKQKGYGRSKPLPYNRRCMCFAFICRLSERSDGRSIPRRRRLSLSENGNPFVRFADISPIRGISHCHFVTSPQRGAPLPYTI